MLSATLFSSENRTDKKPCVFCGLLRHKSVKCLKVSNPAARKEICKESRLCFICFDKNHNASACTWEYSCKHCRGKHNIAICTFNKNQLSRFDNQSSNNMGKNQTNVLLQTALVTLTYLRKQKQTKINALFDTGTQRTYVSEELRDYLKLPVPRKEKFIIKVFRTEDTSVKPVDVVPLKFLSFSKEIVVETLCTPTICFTKISDTNQINQYLDIKSFILKTE